MPLLLKEHILALRFFSLSFLYELHENFALGPIGNVFVILGQVFEGIFDESWGKGATYLGPVERGLVAVELGEELLEIGWGNMFEAGGMLACEDRGDDNLDG